MPDHGATAAEPPPGSAAVDGWGRRGFCGTCGSSLFWEPVSQPGTGILAGTLDQPTGLRTIGHIFVAEKCDFTEIAGGAPRFDGSSDGAIDGDIL